MCYGVLCVCVVCLIFVVTLAFVCVRCWCVVCDLMSVILFVGLRVFGIVECLVVLSVCCFLCL